jgi:hypothetical protein
MDEQSKRKPDIFTRQGEEERNKREANDDLKYVGERVRLGGGLDEECEKGN